MAAALALIWLKSKIHVENAEKTSGNSSVAPINNTHANATSGEMTSVARTRSCFLPSLMAEWLGIFERFLQIACRKVSIPEHDAK